MKHRGTKILSLLLSLVMVLGLLPGMTAYADQMNFSSISVGQWIDLTSASSNLVLFNDTGKMTYAAISDSIPSSPNSYTPVDNGSSFLLSRGYIYRVIEADKSFYLRNYFTFKRMPVIRVTGVTVDPISATLTAGGDPVALTATVSPDGATDRRVKWSVDGSAVTLYSDADCTTPVGTDATNTLTVYAKGTAAGSATVTVTSNADATKSATCAVKVNAAAYTVTYDPGEGSGKMEPTKVEKNAEGKFMYKAESCGFTAPDGKSFDLWKGSDGKEYKVGGEYELTGDLTLTAQWKDKADGGSGDKKTTGSGSGFDLVFNIPGVDNTWEYVGGYAPQRAYRVSLAPMVNGSAALGLTTGESGETLNVYPSTTVYVFPEAEQGYVLDKIVWSLIDGSASYDITETKNFVMPAMDAVVYVTFKPVG